MEEVPLTNLIKINIFNCSTMFKSIHTVNSKYNEGTIYMLGNKSRVWVYLFPHCSSLFSFHFSWELASSLKLRGKCLPSLKPSEITFYILKWLLTHTNVFSCIRKISPTYVSIFGSFRQLLCAVSCCLVFAIHVIYNLWWLSTPHLVYQKPSKLVLLPLLLKLWKYSPGGHWNMKNQLHRDANFVNLLFFSQLSQTVDLGQNCIRILPRGNRLALWDTHFSAHKLYLLLCDCPGVCFMLL